MAIPIIVIILVVICIIVVSMYNNLVSLRQRVQNAWSQIDVQLKRRFDLIPNLQETVKGYMAHESETFSKIAELRTAWASSNTVAEKAEISNQLTDALKTIMAVSENYPDLKASESFLGLQDELRNTENKIAYSRQFYNDTVTMYNTKLEMFPSNLIAKAFNFKASELFEVKDDQLSVVSLDGHRISIRHIELKDHYDPFKVVVPGKTLQEIVKIISGEMDENVSIYVTSKHILFEFDNTRVVSRLLEGEYYKISQMLSSDYETKITINKKEFLNCIDRASLLIRESDKKPIIIDIADHSLKLNINSFFGSMEEEILIQKEGRDLLIGFNPKFLMDVLRVIDDEEINIYLVNPKAPCYIKDDAGTYNYLILPVNFNH